MHVPLEIEMAILEHARERRACVGVVARSLVTDKARVVRMKGATAKDVRRLYRELMANTEYVEAIYRGSVLPRAVPGMEDEEAPYVLVDAIRMRLRSAWRINPDRTWSVEPLES